MCVSTIRVAGRRDEMAATQPHPQGGSAIAASPFQPSALSFSPPSCFCPFFFFFFIYLGTRVLRCLSTLFASRALLALYAQ